MALSISKAKSETRLFAVVSLILLALGMALPSSYWVLIALPLAGAVWLILVHGSTLVSLQLRGGRRQAFQIIVTIIVPLVLSLYFIQRSPQGGMQVMVQPMLSVWYLLPVAIIGAVGWSSADHLDREHPFRGFLIGAVILFVICLLGFHGIHFEYDDLEERSFAYVDKEAAALATRSGRYFVQYLFYVAVVYGAMLAKLKSRHS
jgi:hypothetical protein